MKISYSFILDKVKNKLSGWKARLLSLVGRKTLIQQVTSSISNYYRQSAFLLVGLCNDIDKAQRDFYGALRKRRKRFI